MAAWTLVPCLGQLRTELDRIAPNRDRTTDGTIGNRAHELTVSDHNDDEIGRVPIRDADAKHEVHALDLDADLREPGLTMHAVVSHVLGRCRRGEETRLRYIIWDRRIWSASDDWAERPYRGDSPHTEHAHFSASYDTKKEASTASWGLEDIRVALTEADKKWFIEQIDKAATTAAERVWKTKRDIGKAAGTAPHVAELGDVVAHLPGEHTRIEKALAELGKDVPPAAG
jgi:hypothetical protein